MKVRRYNYPDQLGDIDDLMTDLRRMLLDGHYVLGPEVEAFERDFAAFVDVSHAVGVNSGTDALILALTALGIGPGDEVVTQANTFNATVAAIRMVGARPVLVDAEPDGFTLDVARLGEAIGDRTRVLLPVHLYGKPAPMDAILALAGRHGLAVVEDAAQAHGARVGGRVVGGIGELGCFSFHPSKNLAAAGDAGAVTTADAGLAERLDQLRQLGQRAPNDHVHVGPNTKLDAIQARILTHKLPRLGEWNAARRRIARGYRERIATLPLQLQRTDPDEEHVYHLFQVGCDRRDALLEHLRNDDIDATVRYPVPIHLQPAFADAGWRPGQFPVAERLARQLLCLPIRPDMGEDELDHVAASVRGFFGGGGG